MVSRWTKTASDGKRARETGPDFRPGEKRRQGCADYSGGHAREGDFSRSEIRHGGRRAQNQSVSAGGRGSETDRRHGVWRIGHSLEWRRKISVPAKGPGNLFVV